MSIGRRLRGFLSDLLSGSRFGVCGRLFGAFGEGSFVKPIDNFFINGFAGLVAVDIYKEI